MNSDHTLIAAILVHDSIFVWESVHAQSLWSIPTDRLLTINTCEKEATGRSSWSPETPCRHNVLVENSEYLSRSGTKLPIKMGKDQYTSAHTIWVMIDVGTKRSGHQYNLLWRCQVRQDPFVIIAVSQWAQHVTKTWWKAHTRNVSRWLSKYYGKDQHTTRYTWRIHTQKHDTLGWRRKQVIKSL